MLHRLSYIFLFSTIVLFQLSCSKKQQNPEIIHYFPNKSVFAIGGKGEEIWVGMKGALVKLSKRNNEVITYDKLYSYYDSKFKIKAISYDRNENIWIGTSQGLVNFDGNDWIKYDIGEVNVIKIDNANIIWIGTNSGLIHFDVNYSDTEWEVYTTSNSGLPSNIIYDIYIDNSGHKWIATHNGIVKFDGKNWLNRDLEFKDVYAVTGDNNGRIWAGTLYGLMEFDGVKWKTYNTYNSTMPSNEVWCITIDNDGNKWIGTSLGLVKFDDVSWTILPEYTVNCIFVDQKGNKWIGTDKRGLIVFRDGGIDF